MISKNKTYTSCLMSIQRDDLSMSCMQQSRPSRRVSVITTRPWQETSASSDASVSFPLPLDSLPQCVIMELYFLTFTPMNHQGVFALPLVKVKEKFQITLPAELREALHL